MVVGGGGVTRAAARRDNDGVRKSESGMGPGDSAESMLRRDEPDAFDSVTTLSGPNARCGGLFFVESIFTSINIIIFLFNRDIHILYSHIDH